jgi:hypothetical protein
MCMIVFRLKQKIHNVYDRVSSQTKNTKCVWSCFVSNKEYRMCMIVFCLKQRIQNVYDRVSSQINLHRKNDLYHIESTSVIIS